MRMMMALALMTAAPAVMAGCPQAGSGTCTAATEAAAAIQLDLPQGLPGMQVMFAIAGGRSLVVGAVPMIGGQPPKPADAAAFLCGHPATRSYVAAGGWIEVLMAGRPFLDLKSCEAP